MTAPRFSDIRGDEKSSGNLLNSQIFFSNCQIVKLLFLESRNERHWRAITGEMFWRLDVDPLVTQLCDALNDEGEK